MADELEKFVLKYVVEPGEAVTRLEALNKKIEETGKKANKSKTELKDFAAESTTSKVGATNKKVEETGKKIEEAGKQVKKTKSELKEFASGASDQIGKLVPGIDGVSFAVKALGAEFGLALLAVGALGVGINSLIVMRERYNKQRKEGMDIGVSSLRLEEYQRKFVKASGGNIGRDETTENVRRLSQFSSAIYRDPTRIGQEARTARVLGIDAGKPGESVSVNSIMTQLGEKFSKMTDAQVQAQAKTLGISQDFALGLKKQGASVGEITELKPEEIADRNVAQKQLNDFNAAMERLKDNFLKAENALGERFLPPFVKFIELVADLSEKLPKAARQAPEAVAQGVLGVSPLGGLVGAARLVQSWLGRKDEASESDKKHPVANKTAVAAAVTGAKANAATAKSLQELVDGESDDNAEARRIADQQALAINQFAGAVASFANAVDERQAWAAWAGEIGKASGLGAQNTPGAAKAGALSPVNTPTKFDDIFKAAGEKYGVDSALLKNIANVESHFNPKAVSKEGASGLMQVMPANFKSLGIKDGFDPKQNIMGGAKLFADYLKASNGDVNKALMTYHGGFKESGWGPLTRSYPGKVLGAGGSAAPVVSGESRDKIALRSVQNTIAGRLGVPVGQLQTGGVNRGDVAFANSQLQAGIRNNIFDIQNQLKAVNLPQQTRSKMMTDLREQQSGLMMLRKYGGSAEDVSQAGDRSITIGERAIIINVNGTDDPSATAATIQAHLSDHLGELVNGTSTGMKH